MAYNTELVWREKLNHSEMFMVCFIAMDISGSHFVYTLSAGLLALNNK